MEEFFHLIYKTLTSLFTILRRGALYRDGVES
jgi:hypothetical protein